jgi:CubicO group peptidase (beta-lactamase class C family)
MVMHPPLVNRRLETHMKNHPLRFAALVSVFVLTILWPGEGVSGSQTLPRSTPEREGVSPGGIEAFIRAATASKHEFHTFMFLRHGKVIAEGAWSPYRLDLKNTLYSVSKSFTSTAIGLAESEHRLDIEQPVISFFPEERPDSISPMLAGLTVRDLLMMAVGQDPEPTFDVVTHDTNWVKGFLAKPIVKKPGITFLYNSLATYMLSAIVQKVTGQTVLDYLTPRLFEPLGISGADWETDPRGINTGGWGLRLTTEDMAKFGQLLLSKGEWGGRQVVPRAWVEEATSFKIDDAPGGKRQARLSGEWAQGYCYQFWRCRHDAFRADGAYGQYIVVLPEQDAVIVITAESQDLQGEINLVWEHLLPAMESRTGVTGKQETTTLKTALGHLAVPRAAGQPAPLIADSLSNRVFHLASNVLGIDTLAILPARDSCTLLFRYGNLRQRISFGATSWMNGATELPGPALLRGRMPQGAGKDAWRVAGACRWKDGETLELTLKYLETPHTVTVECRFTGRRIEVVVHASNNGHEKDIRVSGVAGEEDGSR